MSESAGSSIVEGHECAEAVVVLGAGGAAAEVGGEGGHDLLGVADEDLAVD
ncbi:MAG: hypothetical protein QOC54_2443, partial [Baekduia sp.]|nr:hypothetical protein [Baekduia sp.]